MTDLSDSSDFIPDQLSPGPVTECKSAGQPEQPVSQDFNKSSHNNSAAISDVTEDPVSGPLFCSPPLVQNQNTLTRSSLLPSLESGSISKSAFSQYFADCISAQQRESNQGSSGSLTQHPISSPEDFSSGEPFRPVKMEADKVGESGPMEDSIKYQHLVTSLGDSPLNDQKQPVGASTPYTSKEGDEEGNFQDEGVEEGGFRDEGVGGGGVP